MLANGQADSVPIEGPPGRIVRANAAAALLAAGIATDLRHGAHLADEAIATGKAARALHQLGLLSRGQVSVG